MGKGYLHISIPQTKKSAPKSIMIDLEEYPIEDGVIKNPEAVVERIKSELSEIKLPPISLFVRCEETYRNAIALPSMSYPRAMSYYKRESKLRQKENFSTDCSLYKHPLGYIFSTYYIPNSVINSFGIIAKLLGTKLYEVEPYGFCVDRESGHERGGYVHFYIRGKVCTMTFILGKDLIATYDFAFDTEEDIVTRFLLVMSKHEFEGEHIQITHYALDSDMPIDIKLSLERIEA